jgi:hypothetical protein
MIDTDSNSIEVRQNQISFRIKMIQKLENRNAKRIDYKIAVPLIYIESGIIPREAIFNVTLKSQTHQVSFMIKKIQKMGKNNYKIAVPPDLINEEVIPRIGSYEVTLKLLKQKLTDGFYKIVKGEVIKIGEFDDDEEDEEGVITFEFD